MLHNFITAKLTFFKKNFFNNSIAMFLYMQTNTHLYFTVLIDLV